MNPRPHQQLALRTDGRTYRQTGGRTNKRSQPYRKLSVRSYTTFFLSKDNTLHRKISIEASFINIFLLILCRLPLNVLSFHFLFSSLKFLCLISTALLTFHFHCIFQSVINVKTKMSLSLYERTAKNDDNSLTTEERTLFDFYSSPLDRNGVRVSLDKVQISQINISTLPFFFRLETTNCSITQITKNTKLNTPTVLTTIEIVHPYSSISLSLIFHPPPYH